MAKTGTAIRTEVVGLPELQRKLKRAGEEGLKAEAEGFEVGAQVIVAAAQQNIRDKDIIDTGNLLDSVQPWPAERDAKGNVSVDIGTPVEYGTYHEFGTSRMAARPWLRPALDENIDKARKAVEYAVKYRLDHLRGGST